MYIIKLEYHKITNLLHNTNNKPSKFKIRNLDGVNDDARVIHNTNNQNHFKTTKLKSGLFDYNDAYILGNCNNYWSRSRCSFKTSRQKN